MTQRGLRRIFISLASLSLVLACGKEDRLGKEVNMSREERKPYISSDQALQIARLDAENAYGDLSPYRINIVLERDGWHIDFELRDSEAEGGGPHYVIDPTNGKILSKRYEQ